MDVFIKIASCLLVVCVALIVEVLCAGSSFSSNNAWPRLGNQSNSNANPNWQNSGPSTPWPELGQRRYNQNSQTLTQNGPTPVQSAPVWVQNGQGQNGPGHVQSRPTWVQNGPNWVQSGPTLVQNNPMASENGQNQGQSGPRVQNGPVQAQSGSRGPTWVQNGSTWTRASTDQNFQNVASTGTRITSNFDGQNLRPQTQGNVQDEELRNFSETLLQRDSNNAARFVTINFQGKTTSRSDHDEAPLPLLTVQRDAYNIPTIAKLMFLYNNYILETNANEHVSPQEKQEENDLLDALLSTSVMQTTKNFLVDKGKIGRDPKEFRDILKEIWFNMYSRGGGRIGSSGFEHVFLAELKNGEVSGLHNWVYFNEEEAKNAANYLGYLKKIDLGDKGAILKYHFKFHNVNKPVGSMFIGTSPELEIALYTTCFLLRADKVCPLRLAGNNFIIRTYTYRYRGKNLIGSAFPEI